MSDTQQCYSRIPVTLSNKEKNWYLEILSLVMGTKPLLCIQAKKKKKKDKEDHTYDPTGF
jgi:hypothetical protein